MLDLKYETIEDINNVINNFYKVPKISRFVIANKVHSRLKELDKYVKINKGNPILNYPSERFIVNEEIIDNEYRKYAYLLEEDVESFNFTIYNDMTLTLDNINKVYEIINFCKEQNNKADEIYLEKFPSHRDLIHVFKMAVTNLNMFFLGSSPDIFRTSLDDIEFIISTNMLTDSHVRRLLLPAISLSDMRIYKSFFKNNQELYKRLVALFNTQINLVKQRRDEFILTRPFNDESLKAYLKIQKMGYEEMLVSMDYNGDYDISNKIFNIDVNEMLEVDIYVKNNQPHLKKINMIDKFKLEHSGLKPIMNKTYNGNDYYLHYKKNVQYLLYKDNNGTCFMIGKLPNGEFKSYRISLNESNSFMDKITSNTILESTFITDYRKMNR